jgi:signal transduction histidine kinase
LKQNSLYKVDSWFYHQFESIKLKQLGYFSIWFILVFTILFSFLLIYNEYKQFTSVIKKERQAYILKEHKLMFTTASQIEKILEFAYERHDGDIDKEFFKFISVFNESSNQFVALYDKDMKLLKESISLDKLPENLLHVSPEDIVETTIKIGKTAENVLLLSKKLKGKYYLVIGHYLKPYELKLKASEYELKHRLIRLILEIVTLSFILFGFSLGASKIFNAMLERDVNSFLDFFADSKKHYHCINPKTSFFEEFKSMAKSANDMLFTIVSQKNELRELNASLEARVEHKTLQLQELLDSQKRFIRYAIHETNTPLSVMISNIELFNMKFGRNDYLAKIEASTKQIFNIYDDLSFLVKKDQIEYPKLDIDLEAYLKTRIYFFDEVATLSTLKFNMINRCEKEIIINFNETKLQRIIDNNLTNAIKYTKHHQDIEITLE